MSLESQNGNSAAESFSLPQQHYGTAFLGLFLILVVLFAISLFVGRYPQPYFMPPRLLSSDAMAWQLFWNLRLPRLIAAVLVGMCLAAAGSVFQTVFANPLVEPGFLGVSQGAAFGAALCIVYGGGRMFLVQGCAALFAISGLVFSYMLARKIKFGGRMLRLVLAGIAVSALFSSGLGILKYLADPVNQLSEITFWLLGGLWGVSWDRLAPVIPAACLGLLVMFLMRWRVNALGLEDATAFSLGLAPARERALLLFAAVLSVSAMVSISGMIGWVGLIVPHLARRCFGADCRHSMPAAMLMGAGLTLICDDIARCATTGELPLGILTSLIGAGGFLLIMTSQREKIKGHIGDEFAEPLPEAEKIEGRTESSASDTLGALLVFDNVSFAYVGGGKAVSNDIDLNIKAGTVTAILGPNGAGKTTLLHLALGWLKPQKGTITFKERNLENWGRRELGCRMALVPQRESAAFEHTVLDTVLLGRSPHLAPLELPREIDINKSLNAIEKCGIKKLAARSVNHLSGGELQMVLLARALAQEPELLLLDEPFSHLDLANRSRLLRVIRELSSEGVTVVMTTHEPEIAAAAASHLVLMRDGRIHKTGELEKVFASPFLSETYGIDVKVCDVSGHKMILWN